MRIAVYHNLPTGGARRVVYEHCRGLRAAGHYVAVFEPETAASAFCDLAPVADELRTLPCRWDGVPAASGLRRALSGLQRVSVTIGNHRRLFAMQQDLAGELRGGAFDLVYVHQDCYEQAPSLLRLTDLPTVYFCQEPSREVFESPLSDPGAPRTDSSATRLWTQAIVSQPFGHAHLRYRLMNERLNARAATLVLANSDYSRESILRAHGVVARRCTLGVDTAFFAPGDEAREDYVLSVGAFAEVKGFRFLVRALGLVRPELRPRLVLAGDREAPGETDLLRHLAAQNGVSLSIHARVQDSELRALYRRARLFLYAPYLEPLGLTPLEAMACGTPVLGVREGGVRETVQPGTSGWLVDRDEQAWAATLSRLLANADEIEALRTRAREYVIGRWTWEISVQELLGHFARVLAADAPPGLGSGS